MLSEALSRASRERGLSLRQVGKQLGYKQAVVLSHMTSGRVPIPIDRAEAIAEALEIEPKAFLKAVLKQRHPDVSWALLGVDEGQADEFTKELALCLGMPISELNQDQRAVMREVAAELRPRRRWLSVHELGAIEALRDLRPHLSIEGLSPTDLAALRSSLQPSRDRR